MLFREDFFDESGEDGWILDSHFREDFTIEGNRLGLEEGDELRVARAVFSKGVVQTDDPEGAEGALLGATVTAGILTSLDDGFLGLREELFAAPAIAFGLLQDIIVALFGHYAALDSGHTVKTSKLGMLYSVSKGQRSQIPCLEERP